MTAALWSTGERSLTQRWAAKLRRAGWLAWYHDIQQDPAGVLRAVTLFDTAGEHAPYDEAEAWRHRDRDLHGDEVLIKELAHYGIQVTRSDPDFAVVDLDHSGLV